MFLRLFGLRIHFTTQFTARSYIVEMFDVHPVDLLLYSPCQFFLYCEFPLLVWKTNKSNVMHSMGHIKFSVMPTTSSISHRNTFSYFVDYSMKKPPPPYNAFILYASFTDGIKCIVSFWAELFVYFGFETFCCLTTNWKSQRGHLCLVFKLECH